MLDATGETAGDRENDRPPLNVERWDYRALGRQMPAEVREFVAWIITLDDPDPESQGFQDRRAVTMTEIIRRAREVMGVREG